MTTTTGDRAASWYQLLAAAVENPAGTQQLRALMQRAPTDPGFIAQALGTDDPAVIGRFLRAADAVLRGQEAQMDVSGAQRQMYLLQMELMQKQTVSTHATIEDFKLGMRNALKEAQLGYAITKWMYIVLFGLGILLVLIAVGAALLGRGGASSTWLGVIGGASTVATLLFGQQKALESSRADLMQLQIAVFSWLDNSVRLSTSVPMIAQKEGISAALLQELWQQSHKATAEVLELVQIYCEARAAADKAQKKSQKSKKDDDAGS